MKRTLSLLLCVLMLLLSACSTPAAVSPTPEATEVVDSTPLLPKRRQTLPEPESSGLPADGKYVTSALGMYGPVTIATVFADGKITDVRHLSSEETPYLGSTAIDTIPGQIVEHQSIIVDSVAGATLTSMAIKTAVRDAITKAGGDPALFEVEVEKPAPKTDVIEKEADVVVMGGGAAGLMAAWTLVREGKSVILFEKMDFLGGCFATSTGGIICGGSDLHQAYGIERLPNPLYASVESFAQGYSAGAAASDSPWANPEVPFCTQMLTYGTKVVNLLHEEGMAFDNIGIDTTGTPHLLPDAPNLIDLMVDRINYIGGCEIILSTPVTDLQIEDGAVTGVVAQSKDGTTYRVSSKAVLLASGGFGKNQELMEQYNPDYLNFYIQAPVSQTGDGLLLAQKAGADFVCMDRGMTSFFTASRSKRPVAFLHMTVSLILVNAHGERFTNERGHYKQYLHEFENPEHGGRFYFIFDEEGAAMAKDLTPYDDYLYDTGDLLEFDSIEAMAAELDLPNLPATIETTMAAATSGSEDPLGNPSLPVFELKGKMYALQVENGPYITHGGVKTDVDTHVLTPEDTIIPGLYAAGDVTGSAEERDGVAYGNGATQSVAFGMAAGETIAAEID